MVAQPPLVVSLVVCLLLVSIACDTTGCDNGTAIKKRRGRRKKVTEEKATTWTTEAPTVPTPTGTTFDEYETWFDKSGWWHAANKTRTPGTTKKRRTRVSPRSTKPPRSTSSTPPVTSFLERMYYSMKDHYTANRRELDGKVRDIIAEHDKARGVEAQYTWQSLHESAQGAHINSELKELGISVA